MAAARRRIRGGLAPRALAVVLAAAAAIRLPAPSSWAGPAGSTVAIEAREFAFEPAAVTASAGEVTFTVTNEGAIEHNFVVENAGKEAVASIPVIEPGASVDVKAVLEPGTYRIVCTLPGHAEAGMVGTLTVK